MVAGVVEITEMCCSSHKESCWYLPFLPKERTRNVAKAVTAFSVAFLPEFALVSWTAGDPLLVFCREEPEHRSTTERDSEAIKRHRQSDHDRHKSTRKVPTRRI